MRTEAFMRLRRARKKQMLAEDMRGIASDLGPRKSGIENSIAAIAEAVAFLLEDRCRRK